MFPFMFLRGRALAKRKAKEVSEKASRTHRRIADGKVHRHLFARKRSVIHWRPRRDVEPRITSGERYSNVIPQIKTPLTRQRNRHFLRLPVHTYACKCDAIFVMYILVDRCSSINGRMTRPPTTFRFIRGSLHCFGLRTRNNHQCEKCN